MEKETLRRLERLNELSLTDAEKEKVLAFFEKRENEFNNLNNINTDNVERMVHVRPFVANLREDVNIKLFTRDELQKDAPQTMDGYWQVPRLVE